MASSVRKPTPISIDVNVRNIRAFVAPKAAQDEFLSIQQIASSLDIPEHDAIDALRVILLEAGYKRTDEAGPAWLQDGDFRAVLGARVPLPGMPGPVELGRHKGFPVTAMSVSLKKHTNVPEALALELGVLQHRVRLVVDCLVEDDSYKWLGGKKAESSEPAYEVTMKLGIISMRLADEEADLATG